MNGRQAAAGLWLLSFALCADRGETAAACSLRAPSVIRLRAPNAIAFIGTGEPDTVLAGPGAVDYTTGPGHFGRGAPRAIYGQVVRVDRAERQLPEAFREAIAGDDRTVILVPWDYGPDCRRVPWGRSARWLPPGSGGAFVAQMRDRAHWAEGRPTFDVIPEVALYPPAFPHQRRFTRRQQEVTPEDFLTLYELLPDYRSLIAAPDSAIAPLVRWARANPDRAANLPVIPLISFMRWEARVQHYRDLPSPIAGTYRVVYRAGSGDSSVFYVRTEGHPTALHLSDRVVPTDTAGLDNWWPIGHSLLVQVASTLAGLPPERLWADDPRSIQGYFQVVDSVSRRAWSDSLVLPGSIDLHRQAVRMAGDSAARAAIEAAVAHQVAAQRELYARRQPGAIGRFVITRDGPTRYELFMQQDGAPVLVVRAERISPEHYPAPRYR
jgi:hypothetical protein